MLERGLFALSDFDADDDDDHDDRQNDACDVGSDLCHYYVPPLEVFLAPRL
jgi:hypothetical protein